jgi:hypothetical protein
MFAYNMLATHTKCTESIFITEESTSPVKTAEKGWICNCSTRILVILLVILAAYSQQCFYFLINGPPVAGSPGFGMSPFTTVTPSKNPIPSLRHYRWSLPQHCTAGLTCYQRS